jgi:sugar phosphate isomerase/epimerase
MTTAQQRLKFEKSLEGLSKTVPPEMIYFFQISDAYKMEPPMANKVEDGLRPRGRWSHDWRPLPFQGGYLPVVEVVKAVLGTGFRGWFSTEVFDSKEDGDMGEVAKKAMEMHEKLIKEAAG